MPRPLLALLALALLVPGLAGAQTPAAQPADSTEAPRLYLDCSDFYCDPDFYRTEINFLNHVRNSQDADIHLLITPQQTGGGGTEYTLLFIGRRRFAGQSDTLRHVTPPASSEDDRRRGLARAIKLGLMPFVAATPLAANIEISYRAPSGGQRAAATPARDPWNFWSFSTRVSGFFQGESRVRSSSINGSLSANRTTEDWKIRLSAHGNERESTFKINETNTVKSEQSGYGLNGLVARSLGQHWSAGLKGLAESSTFLNYDLHTRLAPAVEFNFFPYRESTRRQLTTQYSLGYNSFDYRERTILNRTSQSMLDHTLLFSLSQRQQWGSLSLSAEGAQYLHDTKRYRGNLFGEMDVRLIKGLSINFFGGLSYVRDQIHLPAGNATPEEVLLRLRQLETNYSYFTSVGISYTFGSIYNNVVNPRFGGGGGGRFIMF